MLSTYAQVELLVAGLHAPPAPGSEPMLSITAEDNKFAWNGFHGEAALPDDSAAGGARAALEAIEGVFATDDGTEWFLGRWAATGDRAYLGELVRRAKHRDGSSAAISVSSYAMELLRVAVETDAAFLPMLRELDYNPSNVKFGNYPVVQDAAPAALDEEILDHVVGEVTDDNATTVTAATGLQGAPAGQEVTQEGLRSTGPVIDVPRPVMADAGVEAPGASRPAVSLTVGDGRTIILSITEARTAADTLERAIRRMILPGEGYRWDDDATLSSSALVVFDPELVKAFESFTSLNSGDGPDAQGRFVLGAVTIEADGRFIGQVFTKTVRKERRGDMNDAKFYVAARVRHLLSDPAAQLAAGVE